MVKKSDKKFDAIEQKAKADWARLEEAIYKELESHSYEPELVAPLFILLYAEFSNNVDIPFPDAVGHAVRTLAMVYEIDIEEVAREQMAKMHEGNDTPH